MCREQVERADKINAGMESEFEGCDVLMSLAGKFFNVFN